MKLSDTTKRNLVKSLNGLAVLMIVGCVFYMSSSPESRSAAGRFMNKNMDDLSLPTNHNERKLGKGKGKGGKGKGSSYYDDYIACVPLYPTPVSSFSQTPRVPPIPSPFLINYHTHRRQQKAKVKEKEKAKEKEKVTVYWKEM